MRREPAPSFLVVAAFGGPLVICAVLASLRDVLPTTNAALVLVLWVVAVAAAGHRLCGLLAALSSAAWFDFFLTEPYRRFTIADRDDIETAVLLTLVGVAVTELALWGRRHQARASNREGYLDGVVAAARMAATGRDPMAVLAFVADQITDVLGVDRCAYRPGPSGSGPRINADGSVTHGDRSVDVDRSGLPVDDEIEILVQNNGRVLGRFVVVCATRVVWPTAEERRVAVALAEQAGAALAATGPR